MAAGSQPLQPVIPGIENDYRLMVERVLPELGWKNPEEVGVPTLRQIEDGLRGSAVGAYLLKREAKGVTVGDRLLIVPRVGEIPPIYIGLSGLISRVDPSAYDTGFVFTSLYGDSEGKNNPYGGNYARVHNNRGPSDPIGAWGVYMLLNDVNDPATGGAYVPGLVYTDMTVEEQVIARRDESNALSVEEEKDLKLRSAAIGHVIVDTLARIEEGGVPPVGITRLIHYPTGNRTLVPAIDWRNGRLFFGGSSLTMKHRKSGVRRVVEIPVAPLAA